MTITNSTPTDGIDLTPIKRLSDVIYDIAYTHGWYDEDRTFGDRIALITSELSEALEEHRNGHPFTEIYYRHAVGCSTDEYYRDPGQQPVCTCTPKPEGVPIELADAMIRILDWCASENLDIAEAIAIKVAYNNTRPYRHGGKAL